MRCDRHRCSPCRSTTLATLAVPQERSAARGSLSFDSLSRCDPVSVWRAEGVDCKAIAHPEMAEVRDTRSQIILDYGNRIPCKLILNQEPRNNEKRQAFQFKVEGTAGAAVLTMGVNLDYPAGKPDTFEVALGNSDWQVLPLRGSWFTEAFEGPMSNLQRFVAAEDDVLITNVDDAIRTMALVEACYDSSSRPTTPIPEL